MTDLLVPVLIGAAAALLPFIANWYWQRRRDSIPGADRSLGVVVRGRLRRANPGSPGVSVVAASHGALIVAAPRSSSSQQAARPAPRSAEPPGPIVSVVSGASTEPPFGVGDMRSPVLPSVNATREPAAQRITRIRATRGRSTIQLDPLEAPVDSRRARVTVGALIDDLERAKLSRPT